MHRISPRGVFSLIILISLICVFDVICQVLGMNALSLNVCSNVLSNNT